MFFTICYKKTIFALKIRLCYNFYKKVEIASYELITYIYRYSDFNRIIHVCNLCELLY